MEMAVFRRVKRDNCVCVACCSPTGISLNITNPSLFGTIHTYRIHCAHVLHLHTMHTQFEEMSEAMPDVVFIKIDVDENPDSTFHFLVLLYCSVGLLIN